MRYRISKPVRIGVMVILTILLGVYLSVADEVKKLTVKASLVPAIDSAGNAPSITFKEATIKIVDKKGKVRLKIKDISAPTGTEGTLVLVLVVNADDPVNVEFPFVVEGDDDAGTFKVDVKAFLPDVLDNLVTGDTLEFLGARTLIEDEPFAVTGIIFKERGVDVAAPTLVGIETDKAIILPFGIQVAFNDDTVFFHTNWEADRGDTHDYFRFTNGAWQGEGGTRRDAQSTIDNDPLRGSTSKNSTIYESRMTFMLDDPNGPNAVRDFGNFGCALTCHDNSRAMPLWVNADGEVHKYLNDDHPGRLDLWHHRLGRANPIGVSDDQWVGTRIEGDGDGGSRHGDAGDGPFQTGALSDDGNPPWVFDPDTTGGPFAFKFDGLFTSPLRYCVNEGAADLGPNAPNPVCISYEDAVAKGYKPSEGDTVPRRRLRQPTGDRKSTRLNSSHTDISRMPSSA